MRAPLLAALLLLAAALPACTRHAPEAPRSDRVIDLLARLPEASFSPGSPYGARPLPSVDADDPRDRLAYVHLAAGEWAEWRGLRVGPHATLSFGYGVAWMRDRIGEGSVTFRTEVRREGDAAEAALHWEKEVRPRDLPAPDRVATTSLALDNDDEVTVSVRFSVDSAQAPATWPGIFAPRLLSDGCAPRPDDEQLVVRDVSLDLLGCLAAPEIVTENPGRPVARGTIDPAVDVAGTGGRRTCLKTAAPSRVRYRFVPDGDAQLRFAIGVDEKTGWSAPGDGMAFAVEVDGERVFERRLLAHDVAADRGWQACEVDLARFAGRQVQLDLVTEPLGSADNDAGGWAGIGVGRERTVKRLRAGEAPTVLVILADTLRADRVGDHGKGSLTPRLDREAARSIVFPMARSISSWTLPSIASLFTGLYPTEHGVRWGEEIFLEDTHDTLAERFGRAGYTTGGFVANVLIGAANGFSQGFQTFVQAPGARARALNDRVLDWFDATEGRARLAYVHYFDPHHPYSAPKEFQPDHRNELPEDALTDEMLSSSKAGSLDKEVVRRWMAIQQANYDGEVRYLDTAIGELLDELQRRGDLDNAVIVFLADHGEEFFEHGLLGHGWHVYEETVRVPLFIGGRGRFAPVPRSDDRPVEIKDLLPTLMDQLGLDRAGRERLGPSLLNDRQVRSVFGQTFLGIEAGVQQPTTKSFVVRNGWKLIRTAFDEHEELYDLQHDPGETVDRLGDARPIAVLLRGELDAWVARTQATTAGRRIKDDADTLTDLRALGYVGR